MKNIVIDTNVFISALLKSKNCFKILDLVKDNKVGLLLSEQLLEELLIVAYNPKFGFTKKEKTEFKNFILSKSTIIKTESKISACRDPKDDMVLECAVASKADFIVTGDKDLLTLNEFKGISILTPSDFLKNIKI